MVLLSLWYTEERFGIVSQKCLQSNLWLSHLVSTHVLLLLLESLTLSATGNHVEPQALTFYEWTLCLPADNFPLQQLASRLEQPRLKKKPSCSSQKNQALREKLILCPSFLPWTPPNFTVTTFSEVCSCSDPGRSDAAADFLQSLLTSDVVVWTNGSVPSPLDTRSAGIQAVCGRCSSSSSLSYSAGSVSFSFSAESFALIRIFPTPSP